MSSWREVCTNIKNENFSNHDPNKSALNTQSFTVNAKLKNALLSRSNTPTLIKKQQNIKINGIKHNSKKERSSNQPLLSCCAVLRLHNIYKPLKKETKIPYDTAPAVLLFCPRCISLITPQNNQREAQINNMLLIYTRR